MIPRNLAVFLCCMVMAASAAAVDFNSLVSRADLDFDKPASRSEEGMPIGNGRMGSLIWSNADSLKFQINRNDVFACDCTTSSFIRPHDDYASGCAFADIQFPDFDDDMFAVGNFHQHLSCYDGLVTTAGKGVSVRSLAWHGSDVFAIEIDDERPQPQPISVNLRMLRYASLYVRGRTTTGPSTNPHANVVQTMSQFATSDLQIRDGKIALTQQFRERDYYNASAVVAAVVGRASKASFENETTVRLTAAPGSGKFVIFIASAASFDPKQSVIDQAIKQLPDKSFAELFADNQTWWHDFWSRGFVQLHSADGVADYVEQNYTYFLYVMNSSSRGDFPTHFNGMLWATNGDLRAWGSEYWWANQSCYYNGLPASNRFELLDPTFDLYTRMYDSAALAAEQEWGSKGIYIPETTFFDGEPKLPDDIAAEMRDLYLMRKPWKDRSEKFMNFAATVLSTNSRWNWIDQASHYELGHWVVVDKGNPPFGHVTHIFSSMGKIAYLFWQKYEYTQDQTWLRDRAYPMLKGAVEFYRNFPNLKKDADGKYHTYYTNSNEGGWGVKDSNEDMAALHGLLPVLIRASEILNVDSDMRPIWQEFLANLAPLPTSANPQASISRRYDGPEVFVRSLKPVVKSAGLLPDGNTLPEWNFDLATVNSSDAKTLKIAQTTFDAYYRTGVSPQSKPGTLSRLPIAAAQLGRADAVQYLIPNQIKFNERGGVFRNRMSLREGVGATDCERLGRASEALQNALLQSAPPSPGEEPIIRIFPAWPKNWDATFTLLARGNFLVTGTFSSGKIDSVMIQSQAGGTCRIVNPWGDAKVSAQRDKNTNQTLSGSLLRLEMAKNETIVLTPEKNN